MEEGRGAETLPFLILRSGKAIVQFEAHFLFEDRHLIVSAHLAYRRIFATCGDIGACA